MTAPQHDASLLQDPEDFSFILGGPLFQLFRRFHLSGSGLELVRRRIIATAAVAWVPLLVLSALEGRALGPGIAVPFLMDIEAQVRFLFMVPLLIAAEVVVHSRIRFVTRQFIERDLFEASDRPRFDAAVAATYRMRNSIRAELGLIAFVYIVGVLVLWRQFLALGTTTTWYATPGAAGRTLSLAGYWFMLVSLPIAQFLLLRWYYRITIWARFLWQVSRIDLRLVPTHPDRVGGLGFLALTTFAFAPLAVAHGALVSAWIANRLFLHQGVLLDYKVEVIAVVVLMLLLVFGPLLVFSPQLARAWQRGERDYGPLAVRYAHEFEAKWVHPGQPGQEPLLGHSDIQSMADMDNVYAVARTMRFTLFTRPAVIQLLAATLIPLAPLVLFMMPLGELLKRILGMLF